MTAKPHRLRRTLKWTGLLLSHWLLLAAMLSSWIGMYLPNRSATVTSALPLFLISVVTGVLWWRDRRPPPGHRVSFGYNLTGNVSAICPECGKKVLHG